MTKAIKCVIVGDPEVGKSSIINAYTANSFTTDYTPTVFENYNCNIVVDNVAVDLALWDAAGSEEFDSLRPVSYALTDVYILCFAVDKPNSFANIYKKWVPEVMLHGPETPILLVGTRTDMRNDLDALSHLEMKGHQPISSAQGQAMVQRIGAVHYLECSARTRYGLNEIFEAAVRIATYGPKKAFKQPRDSASLLLVSPRKHLRHQSISQSFPGRRFSLRGKTKRQTDSRDRIPNFSAYNSKGAATSLPADLDELLSDGGESDAGLHDEKSCNDVPEHSYVAHRNKHKKKRHRATYYRIVVTGSDGSANEAEEKEKLKEKEPCRKYDHSDDSSSSDSDTEAREQEEEEEDDEEEKVDNQRGTIISRFVQKTRGSIILMNNNNNINNINDGSIAPDLDEAGKKQKKPSAKPRTPRGLGNKQQRHKSFGPTQPKSTSGSAAGTSRASVAYSTSDTRGNSNNTDKNKHHHFGFVGKVQHLLKI